MNSDKKNESFFFIIGELDNGETIISYIKKKFKKTPLNLIHKLFRKKKIKKNGEIIRYYQTRLKMGEKIEILDKHFFEKNKKKNEIKKTNLTFTKNSYYQTSTTKEYFKTIYEDENILIVSKEYGVTSESLGNSVKEYLLKKDEKLKEKIENSNFIINSSNRIDKNVKGLVIFGKNNYSKKELNELISNHLKIEKEYLALIENQKNLFIPNKIEGYIGKIKNEKKITFFLNKDKQKEKKEIDKLKTCSLEIKIISKQKVCKKAIEEFNKLIEKNNIKKKCFASIKLITGRKHQIRSILSYFKRPVVGDKKYGSNLNNEKGICLISHSLKFNKIDGKLSYLSEKKFFFCQ